MILTSVKDEDKEDELLTHLHHDGCVGGGGGGGNYDTVCYIHTHSGTSLIRTLLGQIKCPE